MAFRNIIVANSADLSSKNNQLLIETKYNLSSVPIEDISCVVVESQHVSISSYAISKMSEYGVTVFVCNKEHLPTSIIMPINNHSRKLKMLKLQLNQTKPFLKRLWQQIVVSKISNQSKCLEICDKEEYIKLNNLKSKVQSGDSTNMESVAAALYFKTLFGAGFTRREKNTINASLNYGYSIIRGVIARTLATYGFETSLGIHHKNEQNNFNLADDLIEPFRPVVDLFVAHNVDEDEEFTPELKHKIFNLLNVDIKSGAKNYSVSYAIEKLVQSLNSCYTGQKNDLVLPTLVELRLHQYE